jgi:hypothetical protein
VLTVSCPTRGCPPAASARNKDKDDCGVFGTVNWRVGLGLQVGQPQLSAGDLVAGAFERIRTGGDAEELQGLLDETSPWLRLASRSILLGES